MEKRFLVSYATFATPTKPQVMDSTFVDLTFEDDQNLVTIQQMLQFVYQVSKKTGLNGDQFAIMGFSEIDPTGFSVAN